MPAESLTTSLDNCNHQPPGTTTLTHQHLKMPGLAIWHNASPEVNCPLKRRSFSSVRYHRRNGIELALCDDNRCPLFKSDQSPTKG